MNRNRIHHTRPGDLTREELEADERLREKLAELDNDALYGWFKTLKDAPMEARQ